MKVLLLFAAAAAMCNVVSSDNACVNVAHEQDSKECKSSESEDEISVFDFQLLSTNDLHSSFEGSGPDALFTAVVNDSDPTVGNYARLCHLIDSKRVEASSHSEPSLVLDAGDWFAGTLFHIVAPSEHSSRVPELEFFHHCGFDATTIGNHDLESGLKGFMAIVEKVRHMDGFTPMVVSNVEPEAASDLEKFGLGSDDIEFKNPSHGPLRRILLKKLKSGSKSLNVGIIGLHGPDASLCNMYSRKPLSFVGFEDDTKTSKYDDVAKLVKDSIRELKATHKADIIIVLGHMGHPEDVQLAKDVPEIDIIIASHTHDTYLEIHGKTIVVQSYRQGQYLRYMPLRASRDKSSKEWRVSLRIPVEETLLLINDTIPAREATLDLISEFKKEVDQVLKKSSWGEIFSYSKPVYTSRTETALFGHNWGDFELARVVGDCLVSAVNERNQTEEVIFFIALAGMIRGYPREVEGKISLQFSDVFKMYQAGFDEISMTPGSPLCSYYLDKHEFWYLLEIGDYVQRFWQEDFLLVTSSRLNVTYNAYGIPLVNHVTATLDGKPFSEWPRLLHVCTTCGLSHALYSSQQVTYGLLPIWPRDRDGKIIPNEASLRERSNFPNAYRLLSLYLQSHSTNMQ